VSAVLAELSREDPAARDLYAARQRALETVVLRGMAPGARAAEAPVVDVEQHALQALERGDAAALQRLAESMVGKKTDVPAAGGEDAPMARAAVVLPAALGHPLPEGCLPRATALGLERVG
jgi:hypothetical protein